jgi:hypothetical protein
MSFSVEKSAHALADEDSNAALQMVLERLTVQSEHVKSVRVLANFGVDREASMYFDTPFVVQGLVVQVDKDYVMGPDDACWFHPAVGHGRSVYSVASPLSRATLQQELDGFNSLVGEYTITKPDEFGSERQEHRIVVDTSADNLLRPIYNKWLQSGITAGALDTEWKRTKFEDAVSVPNKVESMRHNIGIAAGPKSKRIYSDIINNVLSDTTSVYFTNHAVMKAVDNKPILIRTSALGGFRTYNPRDQKMRFFPATLGAKSTYYSWKQMSGENCRRVARTCSWTGELPFNTNVMRPPALSHDKLRTFEDEYHLSPADTLVMRLAHFSSSERVMDKLTPQELVMVSPTPSQSEGAPEFISAPVNMEHVVLQKLMGDLTQIQKKFPSFELFNPKYMKGGRLQIPRDVFEHIALA